MADGVTPSTSLPLDSQPSSYSDQGGQQGHPSHQHQHHHVKVTPDILQNEPRRRVRKPGVDRTDSVEASGEFEDGCVVITPENAIEAHRWVNNYKFGFKKWKSHVTSRPLSTRSDIVKDLYADVVTIKPVKVSTIRPTNIMYVLFCGWIFAVIYLLAAVLMAVTIVGRSYAPFCFKMAKYFLWPFGKFVYMEHKSSVVTNLESRYYENGKDEVQESTSLIRSEMPTPTKPVCRREFWTSARSYVWLILAVPLLLIVHVLVMSISWILVVTIPVAKVNLKAITHVLWMPPDRVSVGDSGHMSMDPKRIRSEIIMYTHQSMNFYYYKYTVDGMNIILVNLLVFVILAVILGYADDKNKLTSGVTKCILAVLAIVPLTYYIGMGIISISAQSSFAVGAILNATFGSFVELFLYGISMVKGRAKGTLCYVELVRSALTGTLIGCVLFIPGICMVIGGIKYRSQNFNPKSASVSALLLFVSIGGVFAPTLFSKIFGDLQCEKCEINSTTHDLLNHTSGLQCSGCKQSVVGLDGDHSLYNQHIKPLVYCIALLLPLAYITGVVFTLKTHTSYLYDEFYEELELSGEGHSHGAAQWSRVKSVLILLVSASLIAVCADLVAENVQDLLESSGVSEYFIGVTLFAMIPELPEIVNGIQFSLQNNVNLGIEIGTNMAIQVCLIQVPLIVLLDLIYPVNFYLVFNDIHLWAVIFSVIVINYIFQDGKTDYFQGSALMAIYIILLCMYYFVPTPDAAKC